MTTKCIWLKSQRGHRVSEYPALPRTQDKGGLEQARMVEQGENGPLREEKRSQSVRWWHCVSWVDGTLFSAPLSFPPSLSALPCPLSHGVLPQHKDGVQ